MCMKYKRLHDRWKADLSEDWLTIEWNRMSDVGAIDWIHTQISMLHPSTSRPTGHVLNLMGSSYDSKWIIWTKYLRVCTDFALPLKMLPQLVHCWWLLANPVSVSSVAVVQPLLHFRFRPFALLVRAMDLFRFSVGVAAAETVADRLHSICHGIGC